MQNLLNRFANTIMPLITMAVFIILFIIGIFVFSYILIFAAIVGLILFVIAYIRGRWILYKMQKPSEESKEGRIIDQIDHEDNENE